MGRRSSANAIILLCLVNLAPVMATAAEQGATAQIVLRWKEVAGAAEYEVEISKDVSFKSPVVRERAKTAGYRWKEIPTVPYYWRARSIDAAGRQSPWSEPAIIDAAVAPPSLLTPPAGATLTLTDELRAVDLGFQTSQVLKGYRVEVASEPRFAERLLDRKGTQSPVAFSPSAPGTFYWRVTATDLKGRDTGFGEVRSFQVRSGAPRQVAPVDGHKVPWAKPIAPVELKWRPGWAAARYAIEVQPVGGAVVKLNSPRPSLSFLPLAAGKYEWRVRADTATSDWSARASFTLEAEVPQVVVEKVVAPLGVPTLVSPSADAALGRGGLSLSWSAVPDADRYEVQLMPAAEGLEAAASRPVAVASLAWPAVDDGTYAWRVRALPQQGLPGAWSEPSRFTVRLPPTVRAELDLEQPSLIANGASSTALRLRLFDAEGQPIRGAPVSLEVSAGAVDPLVEDADGYRTRYVSPDGVPAEGSATLQVKDRQFQHAGRVELITGVKRFALGVRGGWNANFAGPSSPHAGLELRYRTPLLSDRLGLSLRGGFHAASAQALVPSQVETVAISAQIYSGALLALFELPFQRFRFLIAAGPTVSLARVSVGIERTNRVVPGVQALLGAGVRLGPVELVADVGYAYGRVDDESAVLGTGGLFLGIGCLVWL